MLTTNHKELAPRRLDNLRELIRGRASSASRRFAASCGLARHVGGTWINWRKPARIRRVHGGAVSVDSRLEEPLFDDKASIAEREKHHIAQAALQFVEPGDTIYLDGGSTVWSSHSCCTTHESHGGDQFLRAAHELAGAGRG